MREFIEGTKSVSMNRYSKWMIGLMPFMLIALFLIGLFLYPSAKESFAGPTQTDPALAPMPINRLIELNIETTADSDVRQEVQAAEQMEAAIAFIEAQAIDVQDAGIQRANVPLSFAPRILFVQVPDGMDTSSWIGQHNIHAIYDGQAEITSQYEHDKLAAMVWNSWLVDHPFACCEKPEEERSLYRSYRSMVGQSAENGSDIASSLPNEVDINYIEGDHVDVSQAIVETTADFRIADFRYTDAHEGHVHAEVSINQEMVDNLPMQDPAEKQRDRDFYLTSSFYIGDYQVELFLPESEGDDENWSPNRRDEAVIGVTSGILWWIGASQKRMGQAIDLSFNVTIHDPYITPFDTRTKYEPIKTISQSSISSATDDTTERQLTEQDWAGEIMANMGEEGSDQFGIAEHYVAMWDMIDRRRDEMHRDFGFLVFIVDSLNDEDGMFRAKPGEDATSFAYAGRPGPHVIMTYDNGPNSRQIGAINGLKINMAHEMGHVVGSLEEYVYDCSANHLAGYFLVENENCENGIAPFEDSIMRVPKNQRKGFPELALSSAVREMAGWIDSDSDGLMDPVDTTPVVNVGRVTFDEASQ